MVGIVGALKHVAKAYFAGCFGCLGVLSAGLALLAATAVVAGPQLVFTSAGTALSVLQNLQRPLTAPDGGEPRQQQGPMRDLPPLKAQYAPSPGGETLLRIKVVGPDEEPIPHLEVDLWAAPPTGGPPTAGIEQTNPEGVAQFNVGPGGYAVGFNLKTFPPDLMYPQQMWAITAVSGRVAEAVVRLEGPQ